MEKIQVFLREEQKHALKVLAAKTGQKQSELIRKGIDLMIEQSSLQDHAWKDVTRNVAGLWSDHEEIEAQMEDVKERSKSRFSNIYADQ